MSEEAKTSDTECPPDVPEEQTEEESKTDEPETVTLNELLKAEDELIEDTVAVLGAVSDKVCSYVEGYMKRQALYSCLTCIPEAKKDPQQAGGVCLACSYHCHEGHDLIELYTKRNFRCDCGNSKFSDECKCTLLEYKKDANTLNTYNQNFSGIYCVCRRPYPDPEDPVPDEMIQCIICEDWYHSRHLGTEVPTEMFAEMICEGCMTKHEFLSHYDTFCMNKGPLVTEEDPKENTEPQGSDETNGDEQEGNTTSTTCKKPKQKLATVTAKFWVDVSWRKELCTCDDCLKMYEKEDVVFLLDEEDPVQLYEEKGKARSKEVAEAHSQEIINKVNRVALVHCIEGYNELKDKLGEFFKEFADNKRIVREEDVREFFDQMHASKKQKFGM